MTIKFDEQTRQYVLYEYRHNNKTYGEIANELNLKREVVRAIVCREVARLNKMFYNHEK